MFTIAQPVITLFSNLELNGLQRGSVIMSLVWPITYRLQSKKKYLCVYDMYDVWYTGCKPIRNCLTIFYLRFAVATQTPHVIFLWIKSHLERLTVINFTIFRLIGSRIDLINYIFRDFWFIWWCPHTNLLDLNYKTKTVLLVHIVPRSNNPLIAVYWGEDFKGYSLLVISVGNEVEVLQILITKLLFTCGPDRAPMVLLKVFHNNCFLLHNSFRLIVLIFSLKIEQKSRKLSPAAPSTNWLTDQHINQLIGTLAPLAQTPKNFS